MSDCLQDIFQSADVQGLQSCLRDLLALSSLPTVLQSASPPRIAENLADVVLQTLRPTLVYVYLEPAQGERAIEVLRTNRVRGHAETGEEIGRLLRAIANGATPHDTPPLDGKASDALVAVRLPIECLGHPPLGAVVVASPHSKPVPSPLDRLLLQVAVNHAAVSIVGSRQRQEEERKIREETETLEILNRIGQTLSSELDLQKVVQAVTDAATHVSGAAFGAFFYNLVNDRGESYTLYTISGVPRDAFSGFPMPRNTELFGPTFRGEGVVRIDDVTRDPRYGKNEPYRGMPPGHLPVTSYLAVPVVSRSGQVLGGLFFGHPDRGVFTERVERIVVALAAQAAIAVDNARLYEAEQRARRRAERAVTQLQASQSKLQDKIAELQRFEEVVVGRELKMIELEKEIARLKAQAERKDGDERKAGHG
ncbi:GAF domain-containing protein [Candidatus Nitrospira bockiana]